MLIDKEIIHMGLLQKGLSGMYDIHAARKKEGLQELRRGDKQQQQQSSTMSESSDTKEDKSVRYLVSKIKGILKDNQASLWDALLSTNLSVTENSKVPVTEFKFIINSLNLKLTLQEKLMLIRIADPESTGKCDVALLIKRVESEDEISDHARHLILEKFSTALFYNDMSLSAAYNLFDEDNDGVITLQEFVIGMKQLNLGLSIFEIKKLMAIIDIDKNEQLSKQEFI